MQRRSFFYRFPISTGGSPLLSRRSRVSLTAHFCAFGCLRFRYETSSASEQAMRRDGRERHCCLWSSPRGGLAVFFSPSVRIICVSHRRQALIISHISIQGRMTPIPSPGTLTCQPTRRPRALRVKTTRALPLRWARCMSQVMSKGKTAQRSLIAHCSVASSTPRAR